MFFFSQIKHQEYVITLYYIKSSFIRNLNLLRVFSSFQMDFIFRQFCQNLFKTPCAKQFSTFQVFQFNAENSRDGQDGVIHSIITKHSFELHLKHKIGYSLYIESNILSTTCASLETCFSA